MKDPFNKLYNLIMQEYSWNQPNMDKPFIQKWEDDQWEDRSDQGQYQDWTEKDIKPEPTLKQRARKDRKTGLYNIFGDVKITNKDLVDGHLPFQIGVVSGDFTLRGCSELTSLQNCPKKVTGNCWIGYNDNLTSLKGCPKEVGKRFRVDYCDKVSSLIDCPEIVNGDFQCCNMQGVKSMIGATQNVGGNFEICECWELTSLEGCPEIINKDFICFSNQKLPILKGGPKVVKGNCRITRAHSLTSLQDSPKEVGNDFVVQICKNITSLEGCPQRIGHNLDCCYNQNLVSLRGPKYIGREIIFKHTKVRDKADNDPFNFYDWKQSVYGQFKPEQIN